MRYIFPSTYGARCALIPIDKALIPFVSGAILPFSERRLWATDADYEQAYPAFAALQEAMATNCAAELTESIDRIYRLIDTIFNGVQYSATGEPPVVSPAIPAAPDPQDYNLPGLRKRIEGMQGTINAGWFGIGGQPATLADIVNALRIGNEASAQKITDTLDLLNDASETASIWNAVRGTFTDIVDTAGEGAVVATLLASTMAQAAIMGLQGAQLDKLIEKLDRLITSLDGGADAPAGNVVDELGEIKTLLG